MVYCPNGTAAKADTARSCDVIKVSCVGQGHKLLAHHQHLAASQKMHQQPVGQRCVLLIQTPQCEMQTTEAIGQCSMPQHPASSETHDLTILSRSFVEQLEKERSFHLTKINHFPLQHNISIPPLVVISTFPRNLKLETKLMCFKSHLYSVFLLTL